jgi:ankyrin repeat protein
MSTLSFKLVHAVKTNDFATVLSLIASNINPPPLSVAASYGRVEMASRLLDAGVDIDAIDRTQRSACFLAIRGDHFDVLKLLVERGANISADHSLLAEISLSSDERMAALLLDAGAPFNLLSHSQLIGLVLGGGAAALSSLLTRNVDVSALRDKSGHSLIECVILNADPYDEGLETFLRRVVDAVGIQVDVHIGRSPLHVAVERHNLVAMRVLVELGADLDQRLQDSGQTPLHSMCSGFGDFGFGVELLLALGANVSLVDHLGNTACHEAAHSQYTDSLCACVAGGGNLDQPDNHGETPRVLVVRNGDALPSAAEIDASRKRIAKMRLDFVRHRALEICIGFQSLRLNALQTCEILMHSFGALGSLIEFHQWWAIAVQVKHFNKNSMNQ